MANIQRTVLATEGAIKKTIGQIADKPDDEGEPDGVGATPTEEMGMAENMAAPADLSPEEIAETVQVEEDAKANEDEVKAEAANARAKTRHEFLNKQKGVLKARLERR